MELALKNVPQELVADFLREELEPMIKALGIADWSLQKPRRRRIASILFLNVECGAKFLAKFGKIVHGRANGKDKARLFIARVPIYVEMSKREIDRHMLSSLQLENEKRLKRAARRQTEPRSSEFQPLSGLITEIRLGKNVFAGAQPSLMFCQQSVMRHTANAKFTRLAMSVMSTGLFRIDIPYDIVMELIADYSSATITLVLTESPRFYAIIDASSLSSASWERATSCPHWPDHNEYAAQCLVYQFPIAIADFNAFISNLDKFEVLTIARGRLPIIHDPAAGEQDYKTCLAAFEGKLHTMRTKGTRIPFTIKFQVQALVWGNYLHPVSGTKMLKQMESIARLPGIQGKPQVPTVASMRKLFQLIPYPVFDVDPQALDSAELVKTVLSQDQELRQQGPMYDKEYGTTLPENQAWVMKAMVTPTRVLLYGPEPESKNRVLRKFPDKHEYFLRVLFCDEDGQDLTFNPKVSLEAVYRRFRSFFSNGIKIAGRRYSFLGFSHSSLRSHSAWFMAPFIDNNMERQTCDTVISSLGKFSGIKTPAKCAARIGQAFSETPYSVPIKQTGITVGWIPDVKSKDGTRVFSDGVGTMSWDALEEIWNYILPVRSAPTSVQIRLGGVKGMLSLDSRLSGKVICLREESMMKFPSDDMTDLGICDTASKPFRFYLNRQVIKILEDMGTQDDWFITLQARALRRLQSVTATPGNTATFLQQQNIGSSIRFSQCIRKLDMMKLDYRRDEFLKTAVEHIVLRELRLLKHKARIPVPKGVTLFGVMDETAFLQPNEIYVTFSAQRNDIASCPGEGLALVTRSPALHPGDIQIVKMITPPPGHSLLKHRDCVVFSQLGDRDLPSQLSGGDLDGDLYNIIWDEDALPDRSFAPADYPRTTPQSLDRDVNREDIADFFINFMRTDLLGMIAVRHQIMADVKNTGTQDPACKLLAELHSTAVDSSKSGIAVDMMQIPKAPSTRPDFLAPAPPLKLYNIGQTSRIGENIIEDDDEEEDDMRSSKPKYHKSEKILGRLYRSVDENKVWKVDIQKIVNAVPTTMWFDLMQIVEEDFRSKGLTIDYRRQLDAAWRIRNLYEGALVDMIWTFSDNPRKHISEVEAFCGFILNKRGSQTRRQRDASIKLREEMDRLLSWIAKLIRKKSHGEEEEEEEDGSAGIESVLELCLACVYVGCTPRKRSASQSQDSDKDYKSFKSIAACCLLSELIALETMVPDDSLGSHGGGGGGYIGVSIRPHHGELMLPLRGANTQSTARPCTLPGLT